jgi:hypothetical protein
MPHGSLAEGVDWLSRKLSKEPNHMMAVAAAAAVAAVAFAAST